MVHFTAFHGAANLQSSVNAKHSGTYTLAAIYGSLIFSNLFLPVLVIRWLGCKWAMCVSLIAYMPFICAQFFPSVGSLLPAGALVGLGGGPLWCAKCTYLTVAAAHFAKYNGGKAEVIVVRFFGIFFMFYQMAQVWGNLVSSAVLTSIGDAVPDLNTTYAENFDDNITQKIADSCGANFYPGTTEAEVNPNLQPPEESKIHLIAGIYLSFMVLACLIIAVFVDPLSRYDKGRQGSGSGLSGFKLLAVTVKQLGNRYQILLLPITMFIGAEQAFIAADYNASFVACAWGIGNIGFVMICFGVANAIAAMVTGSIVKITGRFPVMVAAFILHGCLMVWMQIWRPGPHQPYMFCLVAALWGVADAVWLVQINCLSGVLFPGREEASYSNFRLWESTGSVIAFICSPLFGVSAKLRALICLMTLGAGCYTAIEIMERTAERRARPTHKDFKPVAREDNHQ
ncbi:UNC93-like protein [Ctenocephalides felis]|uniref:UNC93-like protein n=1 Tax=Ctenocephalides felis TaxID=7515 RepID=UPI000E6E55F0|nr:UNC93-like protein [Ctenocephalides felis]